ncbi:MAG: hypothetical protein FNP40_14395 [Dehalobacter sp. 4CP]|uniref:hypothetical protein n=1 Tax=Dehalobacter sp. CP TaxID=2594474 RepID=UPI0013C5B0C9|nr:hypothetical protein [Dehalobacter sp. 4CP]
MRIDSIFSNNNTWNIKKNNDKNAKENYSTQSGQINNLTKMALSSNVASVVDSQTNSINIFTGEIKNIGNIDGIPLNIWFDSNGMNNSFSPMVNANEPLDSPNNKYALEFFEKHTSSQNKEASSLCTRFNFLYQVANGNMSIAQYNELKDISGTVSTSQLLTSLGIDVSKLFSFNGKQYTLDENGNLHAVIPSNQAISF